MTKTKSTKRALLMSALALLACVSMLVGSTYAWFTDSVTSAGNKIVAGTLDIQLLMKTTAEGEYVDISDETAPIFGAGSLAQNDNAETLWEPGKTQVAYLAIKNNGNLALKYTVGLNVQNVSKDLYKVMQYAVTPDAEFGEVTAWAGNGNGVVVGTQAVTDSDTVMNPGDVHYFALSIHMDEKAGNAYQGGEVNFDLTVLATQATVEADSFGDQYDAMATFLNRDEEGNWLIGTAGELAYFAKSVNTGNKYDNETVKLTADIDLTGYNWIPIGTDSTYYFSGSFDGGNYTISNLYVNAPSSDNVGLFGSVCYGAAIKNVIVNNATVIGRQRVGALVGLAYSGVAIDNCHATGTVNVTGNYKVGGLVGGDYFTMTNCSVGAAASTYALRRSSEPTAFIKAVYLEQDLEGDCAGGLAGFVAEGAGIMSGNSAVAVVEGTRKVGGVFGYVGYDRTVKECSFTGTVSTNASAEYIADNSGKITVGGIIGEIGTSKGSVTLVDNAVGNVTLNGVDGATTGAVVGKDRNGNQTEQIAALNAASEATVKTVITSTSATALDGALASGGDVVLADDLSFSTNDTTANSGYGKTGLTVTDGSVLDGNGNTLTVNNANGTWDCAIDADAGTIQNLTVNGAFRGIFMGGASGDVYIDNVVIDKVCYTFNSDGGNKNYGVYISNSTLNGWTSYSNVHKEVVFTNCNFGAGTGSYKYAFCRPYNASVFENCVFEKGFEFDTSKTTDIVFKNCYYGDTLITAENAAALGDGETTFFYNGLNDITIE